MNAFSGGDKLLRKLKALAEQAQKSPTLSVGFLEGATYPDGASVPVVAAANEFGTDKIPSRPFFRTMVAKESPGWGDKAAKAFKATDGDGVAALKLMGEDIKGALQQSIIDTNEPPLSPATIARKGFDKPLIDTSHMLNSIDYEVEEGGA